MIHLWVSADLPFPLGYNYFFFSESAFIKRSMYTNYKDALGPNPLARETNTRKRGLGGRVRMNVRKEVLVATTVKVGECPE
jgi:hypothetical protein